MESTPERKQTERELDEVLRSLEAELVEVSRVAAELDLRSPTAEDPVPRN
jgi:hypothetical protein